MAKMTFNGCTEIVNMLDKVGAKADKLAAAAL